MKKFIFIALLSCSLLVSCGMPLIGNGIVVSEDRSGSLGSFDAIDISTPGNVVIVQTSGRTLNIESDSNIIDKIDSYVDSGVLKIKIDSYNVMSYKSLVFKIGLPSLRSIKTSGTADIETLGTFLEPSASLSVFNSGTSKLSLSLSYSSLYLNNMGTGNVTLSGSVASMNLNSTGTGNLYAYGLTTGSTNATLTGTGNAQIYVSIGLTANLTGTGNLYYQGSGSIISKNETGLGRVIHYF